ncbi:MULTISPECIES: hypothetical protein [unclassified Rhizobium]|uniref:hypothetical protein n=1 Tax=unclassified Rhizobium TaxID=2613769 RepID=UPI001AE991CB|nr:MULTISPECIES: hypothetical protein [unclassified Rhizobium]MBP2460173.1 capsular polysaccharide transport system ATP-binding protein [Rhizobium sp. PvP014]MBP2531532.1 capsular polysaccharide transport system ATP-binding protein [Rhizobium sp. PvP099]
MTDIELQNVTLDILQRGKRVNILEKVSFSFPREHIALIGESRANAVAVIDLLCRRLLPQRGRIVYRGRISWPIGHMGPFSVAVTGTQATSHFATLYGVDRGVALDFLAAEFQGARELNRPIYTWPRPLQVQFMLLMSLIPNFDIYIVDSNMVLTEDVAFTNRFLQLFFARIKGRTALFTARQVRFVKQVCKVAVVVGESKLILTGDLEMALRISDKVPSQQDVILEENTLQADDGFLL